MSVPYKNPITPLRVQGGLSIDPSLTFGNTFSVYNVGGFMEVGSLNDLVYTIPTGTTGSIEYSGNTIPIEFTKGTGTAWSPDVLTLYSDNISSGRRRIGMLVYVLSEDQTYQFSIDNYVTLWNSSTAATGTVSVSEFGTTVNNSTAAGQNFINAWTGSTIEGVNGVSRKTANWRKYYRTQQFINNLSTGLFYFTGITITSLTTFSVSPVKGWVVNNESDTMNPTITYVEYSGQTGLTTPYLSSATITYISLTSGGTITLSSTAPTTEDQRKNIYLGKIGHANLTSLIQAFNEPDYVQSPISQLRDMFEPIQLINSGVYPSSNGANLNFNTSAGNLYGLGINYINNLYSPNNLTVGGQSPATFQYRTQTGGTTTNVTLIDPTKYDNGGVITTVGGGTNNSTNQRIFLTQNGTIRVQYGQQIYSDLPTAIAAANTESFVTFSNFRDNAVLIGILSVRHTATDLSSTTQARFLFTSKFGETIGSSGGISTTTLQQAYNNSTTPEIVTDGTLGAVSIKNGTGNADNVTNLLEGQNTAGSITSFIRADGLISGSSFTTQSFTANSNGLTATTISATTYQNLPFSGTVTGNGTSNYIPKWTGTTGLSNSLIYDDGTNLGIGTTSPSAKLDIITPSSSSIGLRISGDSTTDLVRITQTGSGNAILVEDSSNPDSTPFVITSGGTIGVGITTPDSLLHVHNGSAGSVSPIGGTTMTIENNSTNYLSLLSSDSNLSGIVFGSPSDSFGSFIRWGHTSGKLEIGTGNANDYIEFYVENSSSKAYLSSTGFGVNKLPSAALDISGNSIIRGTLTATTISATTYQNLPLRVSGTGTQDYVTKWDSSTVGLVDGQIYDTGAFIGIATTSPQYGETFSIQTSNKGITIDSLYIRDAGGSLAFGTNFDYSTWGSSGGEIAIGTRGVLSNSTGTGNIGIGDKALENNVTGNGNIAIGATGALFNNITGSSNIAIGQNAMLSNTEGQYNVAIGEDSLFTNIDGNNNTVLGYGAGYSNLGKDNVYIGYSAGYSNSGNGNIFIGNAAGYGDTSSSNKLNIGDTIFGDLSSKLIGINKANPTSTLDVNGTFTVSSAMTAGNTVTIIGNKGSVITNGGTTTAFMTFSGSNTVGGTGYTDFIGVTNTAAGATNINKTLRVNNTGGLEVINNAYTTVIFSLTDAGVLSTPGGGTSDLKTKKNVEYIEIRASDLISKLKPVKFEFKNNEGVKRHGFIAQDVLEVEPDLVLGDGHKENGTYGLDYDGILAMTVKSLQECLYKIEQLENRIKDLENK